MKDFSLLAYKQLLIYFRTNNYNFFTYEQYLNEKIKPKKFVILRHDVDRKACNALKMASLENELDINASYYFRIVKGSNQPSIIKKIAKLGHEIGYHYEDLSSSGGNYLKAIKSFESNLEYFNNYYPIKTICMHGSPWSKWDNKDLWKKYNYKNYGVLTEPYFDIDFNKIFYLTDASRAWNNEKVTIRDKVNSDFIIPINSIFDIFNLLQLNKLPNQLMLNVHPHNWTNITIEWTTIKIWQKLKNKIKSFLT